MHGRSHSCRPCGDITAVAKVNGGSVIVIVDVSAEAAPAPSVPVPERRLLIDRIGDKVPPSGQTASLSRGLQSERCTAGTHGV